MSTKLRKWVVREEAFSWEPKDEDELCLCCRETSVRRGGGGGKGPGEKGWSESAGPWNRKRPRRQEQGGVGPRGWTSKASQLIPVCKPG